jgi:hypothetical protein
MDTKRPDPELIDDENPEWSEEDFAKAVPFSALPIDLQHRLSSPKQESEVTNSRPVRQPAA